MKKWSIGRGFIFPAALVLLFCSFSTGLVEGGDTFNLQITVSPTVPLTNAYLMTGVYFIQEIAPNTDQWVNQFVWDVIPLGNLPAATSGAPDVVTVTAPVIETQYFGGFYQSPFDVAFQNGNMVALAPSYGLLGLYSPAGVSVTDPSPQGSFTRDFIYDGGTTEQTIVEALTNGDTGTLSTFWQYGMTPNSHPVGQAQPLMNFSNGTPGGSVNVQEVATPEPSCFIGIMVLAMFSLLPRRRIGQLHRP